MKLQEIANTLDEAAKNTDTVEQISEKNKFNLEQAYAIQRLSIENRKKRGEKVVGYKLGFTSYAKMEQMGVHDLIWGILTDDMKINFGETVDLNRWIHPRAEPESIEDRKSTRLNSSHVAISYAVFCLKKKKKKQRERSKTRSKTTAQNGGAD